MASTLILLGIGLVGVVMSGVVALTVWLVVRKPKP